MSSKGSKKSSTKSKSSSKPEKGEKRKTKKQSGEPKRPQSAYLLFSNHHRAGVKEADPSLTFGLVGKKLGEMWKSADDDEKKQFQVLADKEKARYEGEMKAFKANKAASDSDDDSDSGKSSKKKNKKESKPKKDSKKSKKKVESDSEQESESGSESGSGGDESD